MGDALNPPSWEILSRIDKNNVAFYDICKVSAQKETYKITIPKHGIGYATYIARALCDMLIEIDKKHEVVK